MLWVFKFNNLKVKLIFELILSNWYVCWSHLQVTIFLLDLLNKWCI